MGNTINNVVLWEYQKYSLMLKVALLQTLYHIQKDVILLQNSLSQKWMRLTILAKHGDKWVKVFLSALGVHFNLTKFQNKSATFFFQYILHIYTTIKNPNQEFKFHWYF